MRFFKAFCLALALLMLVGCFVSCKDEPEVVDDVYYTVTFNTSGGTEMESIKVLAGTKIAEPIPPEKEGYIFNYWRNGTEIWDFKSNPITSDITLTASWLDARSLFDYRVEDGEVLITGYKGGLFKVKIPTVLEGYPVVAIDDHAFESVTSETLAELTIGENIRSIGDSAFYGCGTFKIIVETKPEHIGEKAFFGCEMLERIELGNGVTRVPFEAFSGCKGLKEVILSETVESIAENAFELCVSLDTIVAHNTLKSIEDSAFMDCEAFNAVCYFGTSEEWAQTQIAEGNAGNDAVKAADLYIYSETEPADDLEGKYWYFSKDGRIRVW